MTHIDGEPAMSPIISGPERLPAFGLTVDVVASALGAADRESAHCSDLDPPILEGLLRWGRATRALREQLVPNGWAYDNPNNLARTIHPSGDFAVVLATGDEGTGLPGSGAGPRHARGSATEQAIHANGQLAFEFGSLLHLVATGRPARITCRPGSCCTTPNRSISGPSSPSRGVSTGVGSPGGPSGYCCRRWLVALRWPRRPCNWPGCRDRPGRDRPGCARPAGADVPNRAGGARRAGPRSVMPDQPAR